MGPNQLKWDTGYGGCLESFPEAAGWLGHIVTSTMSWGVSCSGVSSQSLWQIVLWECFFFSPSNCLEFWTLWWQEATVFPKRLQSNGPLKSPRAAYLKVVIKTQLHLKLLPVSIWYDICGSVDHCEESRNHSWPERLDVLHLWLHPPVGEPLAEASPQPLLSSFLDNSLPLGSACWLSVNYAFKGMETNWFLCQSLLLPLQSYFKRP